MAIKKKQRQEMKDYLVAKLEGEFSDLDIRTKQLISPIESTYIFPTKTRNNVIFLLDQEYPNGRFEKISRMFHNNGVRVIPVFYKDGETFFRSAAKKYSYKQKKGLSLKNYSDKKDKELYKMIFFRPEESFVNSQRRYLQYYQPSLQKLEQGIETFEFKPVYFDYSHKEEDSFRPEDTISRKLGVWTRRIHRPQDLRIYKKTYLVKR
jgi:hypothetical protein